MLVLTIFKRLNDEHSKDNLNEPTYRNGSEGLSPLNLHFIRMIACFEIYSFHLKIVIKIYNSIKFVSTNANYGTL